MFSQWSSLRFRVESEPTAPADPAHHVDQPEQPGVSVLRSDERADEARRPTSHHQAEAVQEGVSSGR